MGAQAPRAPPSRRNIAVLSHAEYVPTLTAAAALRVKAALSNAALTLDFESGVRVTCDVGYLCASFGLLRPLCSGDTPDVRDRQIHRQTPDVRQKHRLMPPPIMGGALTIVYACMCCGFASLFGIGEVSFCLRKCQRMLTFGLRSRDNVNVVIMVIEGTGRWHCSSDWKSCIAKLWLVVQERYRNHSFCSLTIQTKFG